MLELYGRARTADNHVAPSAELQRCRNSYRERLLRLARYVLMVAWASMPAAAAAQTQAFTNARVIPISSPPIDKATLVVRDGKIVAVGPWITVPHGA